MVTGKYDVKVARSFGISEEELQRTRTVHTECAHIVPDSTYFDVSATPTGSAEKVCTYIFSRDYSASVLAVLKRFGYAVDNLNGDKVHSLFNVMTMQKDVHDWFDRLEIWFEATVSVICIRYTVLIDGLGS
jgi:hypothetical protein